MYKGVCLMLFMFSSFAIIAQEELLLNLKGKYNVGFQRHYAIDSSRNYKIQGNLLSEKGFFSGKKPMIINIWYPTNLKKCDSSKYSIYLAFENSENPDWNIFLERITKYNRQTIVNNIFRRTILKDTLRENRLYAKFLDLDSKLCIDAPFINRPNQPLIIYQQGLGGTVEESALLCRFLASHGYIVINSTYHSNDFDKIYSDWDLGRSEGDVKFILNYVKSKIPIDDSKINLLGFSFGAQSNLNLISKIGNIRSAVSFDSRFEYYYDYNPRGYKNLPNNLIKRKEKLSSPLLVFANQSAPFSIIDSLVYMNRYYIMVENFNHYDFTSHKQISNVLVNKEVSNEVLDKKINQYIQICKYTLEFFNYFNNDFQKSKNLSFGKNNNFYFEQMKIGESTPKLKKNNIDSPRKVMLGIEQFGIEFIKKKYPNNKVEVPEDLMNSYGYNLISIGKLKLAIAVFEWAIKLYPKSSNLYDSLGEALFLNKNMKKSLLMYKKSLELNPNNENAIKFISTIESLEKY